MTLEDPEEITSEVEEAEGYHETTAVDTAKQIMQAAGINVNSMSGLFTTQKEPLQDLHVIKTWVPVNEKGEIDQNVVRFVTRVMNPFQLSVLMTVIQELINEDPPSAKMLIYFVNQYLINMIPFEGRRVLEQTEGLRARKQSEEQGLDAKGAKNAKNFLFGDKATV